MQVHIPEDDADGAEEEIMSDGDGEENVGESGVVAEQAMTN
jgi:hypothetical protein